MKPLLVIVSLFLLGCSSTEQYLTSPQGQAVLQSSEAIANAAATAAATQYGGPVAGQLASAGLDALATVLQGYLNTTVPHKVVQASPGITAVANAVSPSISSSKPVTQADVDILYQAAAIAAKK